MIETSHSNQTQIALIQDKYLVPGEISKHSIFILKKYRHKNTLQKLLNADFYAAHFGMEHIKRLKNCKVFRGNDIFLLIKGLELTDLEIQSLIKIQLNE